jgi:hypothetical protein
MSQQLSSAPAESIGDWESASGPVTLRMTAADASRIIRALEATSLSFCGSPSASRLAGSYMRLAGEVRRQAKDAPVLPGRP